MGNSLRCCLACVLPCGALDLIRIVHLNGYVEEITSPVTAAQILHAYPDHVLSKPCAHGVDLPRIHIISPDSHLKKGAIYFLLPRPKPKSKSTNNNKNNTGTKISKDVDLLFSQQQVVVVPEKKSKSKSSKSSRRSRNRSTQHVSDWMPHLESIRED